ncbi:hypothetical protein [Nocardia sp. IFM 10818]
MANEDCCPNCGRIDAVQSMHAIAATGVSTVQGSSTYLGVGIGPSGSVVPVLGSASSSSSQTTALAAATRPAPPASSVTGPAACGILLLIAALIMFAITRAAASLNTSSEQSAPPIGFWLVLTLPFALPSLMAFLLLARRSRDNARIARGLPTASALWAAALYCHRCGLCYWPFPMDGGVAARQPISPYEFQQIVWNAGGYGFGQPRTKRLT